MGRYEDILRRNEQLIDNVYEMNEEITDLACENEELSRENEELYIDNEELNDQNAEMKKGIAELHKQTARRRGNRYRQNRVEQPNAYYQQEQPRVYYQQEQNRTVVQNSDGQHRTISLFVSEKTKKNSIFGFLIFFILLLGLGIEPGVALTYDSILDCFLELIFNLYKLCILGGIGFCLRKLWKKF